MCSATLAYERALRVLVVVGPAGSILRVSGTNIVVTMNEIQQQVLPGFLTTTVWGYKPTAKKAQSPSKGRMTWEANAGGRKATGNRGKQPALRRSPRTTGRIRAVARTRKGADAGQVSL